MSERKEKLLEQVCARLGEETLAQIDAYQRQREREARTPLTRSLMVREILETWAAARPKVARARE